MLRRLILALLTLCLALPAAAMPLAHGTASHPTTAEAGASQHHQDHHRPAPAHHGETATANHDCIGCAAPVARIVAPGEPLELRGMAPVSRLTVQLSSATRKPETPPPRA